MDDVKDKVIAILNDLTGEDFSDNLMKIFMTVHCLTQWGRFNYCWSFKTNWGLVPQFRNLTVTNGTPRQKSLRKLKK